MKVLWTLLKVAVVLVIAVPVSLILVGVVVGLAAVVLRLAVLGLLAYGAFKLAARLLRGPKPSRPVREVPALEPADPYYTAAMRELDHDLGESTRR